MSINVSQIVNDIQEFEPLAEELATIGLSAAGISAANMTRISNLEAGFNKIVALFQSEFGHTVSHTVTVTPTPSQIVTAAKADPSMGASLQNKKTAPAKLMDTDDTSTDEASK